VQASKLQIAQLRAHAAELEAAVGAAESEAAVATGVLAEAESAERELGARLSDAEDRLEEIRLALTRSASLASGLTASARPGIGARSGAGNPHFAAALDADATALGPLEAQQTELTGQHAQAGSARQAAQERRDQTAAQLDGMVTNRQALDALRARAKVEEAAEQALIGRAFSSRGAFEAEVAALSGQSAAVARLLALLQSGQGTTDIGSGTLGPPLPGVTPRSGFGPRTHPIYGDVRMHNGVDFPAPTGTPIRAAAGGVVVFSEPSGGYGNLTVVDHGNSLATAYAHQSVTGVVVGQRVAKGQAIGLVGCTGSCTGSHVHFEVRIGGTPVDPLRFF